MKRQPIIVLSFLFIIVLSITACSSSSELSSDNVTNAITLTTDAPAAVVQETVVPQPTSDSITTHSFSIYFPEELVSNESEINLINAQIENASNQIPPVRIDYRVKENSEDSSIFEFLEKAYLAAPQAMPDLIVLPYEIMEIAAEKEYIMPINQDIVALFADENIFPFAKQMAQVDGVYYGVPFIADLMTMVVRDDQQELSKWVDILSSNKVLRNPLADESSLLTFLLYESLEGDIDTSQGFIELDTSKLAQVFSFYYEASQNGLMPSWLNEYNSYQSLWEDSIESTDNIITWYSSYADGYVDSFSAELIPTESGEDITYADGYVICVTNKGEENYAEKLSVINTFTDSLFIANYALEKNKAPVSSTSLEFWGESKNAAVVSYLAPSAIIKPSVNVLNEAGTIINNYLNQILNNELEIPEALAQINEELQP